MKQIDNQADLHGTTLPNGQRVSRTVREIAIYASVWAITRPGPEMRMATVDGLMMDYPLTLTTILRRAETLYGDREIVSQGADKSLHRYSYRTWLAGPGSLESP